MWTKPEAELPTVVTDSVDSYSGPELAESDGRARFYDPDGDQRTMNIQYLFFASYKTFTNSIPCLKCPKFKSTIFIDMALYEECKTFILFFNWQFSFWVRMKCIMMIWLRNEQITIKNYIRKFHFISQIWKTTRKWERCK